MTEILGMSLPGNGTIPAVYAERTRLAKHTGMKIMELVEKNIKPRDIITEDAIDFDLSTLKVERIKEDADYEGVRVRITAYLDRTKRYYKWISDLVM